MTINIFSNNKNSFEYKVAVPYREHPCGTVELMGLETTCYTWDNDAQLPEVKHNIFIVLEF